MATLPGIHTIAICVTIHKSNNFLLFDKYPIIESALVRLLIAAVAGTGVVSASCDRY